MEELKKVDLTGSFSLLTRDGRRCPWIHALRLFLPPPHARSRRRRRSPATRNDGERRGGDERRNGDGGRAGEAELGRRMRAVARRRDGSERERWDGGEESSWCSCPSRGIPVSSPESDGWWAKGKKGYYRHFSFLICPKKSFQGTFYPKKQFSPANELEPYRNCFYFILLMKSNMKKRQRIIGVFGSSC